MTALAACLAWLLVALTCPSFGQAIGPDEPVVAHQHTADGTAGHADTDLCCKALGDSATVLQSLSHFKPDFAQGPAPAVATRGVVLVGLLSAQPLDRPPLYETARSRAKRFVTFSSHAPPTAHI